MSTLYIAILSIHAAIVLTMMFIYAVSIPMKMLIGLIISLIVFLTLPEFGEKSYLIWGIWALVAIVSVMPFNIKKNTVTLNDDEEVTRWLNYKANWNIGKPILSITGLINDMKKPKGKILGKIIPLNARQSKYNNRKIVLTDLMESGGTIVTGATGSGKTVTLTSLLSQDIVHRGVLIIDYKGEQEFIDKMKQISDKVTVIGSSEVSAVNYDPFSKMNESSIIESFLNMRKWDIAGSDGHYKTSLQAYLSNIIPRVLEDFNSSDKSVPFIMVLKNWLATNQPVNRGDLESHNTLKNLLNIMLSSSFGKVFDGRNKTNLNLSDLAPGEIIILSFSSDNKGIGTAVTSFFLRDLVSKATSGKLNPAGVSLYIDEFASMEDKIIVKDILEKGRSLGIKTLLSFQDIHQVAMDTNENYSKTIFGVVNTFIVHAGVTAASAKYYSGIVSSDDLLDQIFINLKKPSRNNPPTCVFISRYGAIRRDRKSEMWVFIPHMSSISKTSKQVAEINQEDEPAPDVEMVTFDLDEGLDDLEINVQEAPLAPPHVVEQTHKPVAKKSYDSDHRSPIPHAGVDTFEPISLEDIDKLLG